MRNKVLLMIIVIFSFFLPACIGASTESDETESKALTESTSSEEERMRKEKIMETAEVISIGNNKNENIAFFTNVEKDKGGVVIYVTGAGNLTNSFVFGDIMFEPEEYKNYYDYRKKEDIKVKTATCKISGDNSTITFEIGKDNEGNNIIVFENGEMRSIHQGSIDDLMVMIKDFENATV